MEDAQEMLDNIAPHYKAPHTWAFDKEQYVHGARQEEEFCQGMGVTQEQLAALTKERKRKRLEVIQVFHDAAPFMEQQKHRGDMSRRRRGEEAWLMLR
ncbi:Uu.00g056870.m01.CDS01 [Anthostomella pinea]|uniref:Uu.00g056870.m01.CDS01 n=1 Tax=Anthostomella pinea TaxID=933095 RepID=A0AAI8VRK9_9PEZI|nr:Uu.00g056870.m01.CDS01 [Anthostomella pinea]